MRSVKFGLLFLSAAFPGVLGRLASGTGKDSMHLGIPIRPSVQDPGDEVDEPEKPVTTELPVTDTTELPAPEPTEPPASEISESPPPDTTTPPTSESSEAPSPEATPPTNPIIENITWEGTGCPARASEAEDASVQIQLEEDGSFGTYLFDNFDAYLGWSETQEMETEAECTISMEIVGIPEGWSFQINDVQAQGYIYLLTGATAVFNSTVFWSGNEEHVFESGKYWPNPDPDPVDQHYITDPLLLTAGNQTEFGSTCAAQGAGPGSGTLNIGFRISIQSDMEPVPDGIVSVRALGITNKLVECEAEAPPKPPQCKKKRQQG